MNRRHLMVALTLSLSWLEARSILAAEPHNPVPAGELPQYILFHKSPTGAPDAFRWNQGHPEGFTPQSIEEIVTRLDTRGNKRLSPGVAFSFSVLEDEPAVLEKSIRALLSAAQKTRVPVLITLDGQNWWQHRPDLWNWWDPALPGFDPANRDNVEWTGWGPQYAIKISWRNWGQQIRIRPAQNIFAPRVRKEVHERMAACLRLIADWYHSLPPDSKYLFAGVKVGWEASINVNAYYHADGNRIVEQPPSDASADSTVHDLEKGYTFGNINLGYAAATSAGLKKRGDLTKTDHETLVHRYLADLSRLARHAGLPAHMIFTHQGGTYAPWDKHLSFKPAINDDSIPGWSFYSHDPQDCGSLSADMDQAGRQQWAAVEWWRGGADTAAWRHRFQRTLTFKQCRLITVYNWESFAKIDAATEAAKQVIEMAATRPAP